MHDLFFEFTDLTRSAVVAILRMLWWLGWDFAFCTIGWSIGWCFFRVLTFGRFPAEALGELDDAPWIVAVLVETSGLALLALGIFELTRVWP
jgi:hypothetical protein